MKGRGKGSGVLNSIGFPGLALIALAVLLLFGRGKISAVMGDVGKGITALRRGLRDDGGSGRAIAAEDRDRESRA